jgi:hypothetical protein
MAAVLSATVEKKKNRKKKKIFKNENLRNHV